MHTVWKGDIAEGDLVFPDRFPGPYAEYAADCHNLWSAIIIDEIDIHKKSEEGQFMLWMRSRQRYS